MGRRADGVGRRRAAAPATGPRARRVSDGRAFVVPSDDLGRLVGEWFPFGKHMIIGVYQTSAASTRRPASASRWSRSARSRPGSPTRSTTRRRRRCGPSRRCGRPATTMLASLVSLAEHGDHAPSSSSRSTPPRRAAGARRCRRRRRSPRLDREEAIGTWLEARSVDHAWQIGRACSPQPAPTAEWFDEVEAVVGRDGARPGAAVGRRPRSAPAACCSRAHRRDQPDRASRRRREVVLADGSRGAAGRRRPRGHREHARDAARRSSHDIEVDRARSTPTSRRSRSTRRELNQVWTNLIDNAVDAMDGHGHAADRDAPRRRRRRGRDHRQRPRHAARRAGARRSSRSSRPRTSARAPVSASTSPAASSSTATAATSRSTRRRLDDGQRAPPDPPLTT